MIKRKKYYFNDFTEESYCKCLELVKQKYRVISYLDYKLDGNNCLWRHDIDYSPHRSLRIAELDNKCGISSYFFIWLHSGIYNFFEKEITCIFKNIAQLGHQIGLHFDPDYNFYNSLPVNELLIDKLAFEKRLLEDVLEVKIHAFSLHNPSIINFELCDDEYCGMVNVNNKYIKKEYKYLSDSFCYWRFERLINILTSNKYKKIHILTHPVCWTPKPMAPYKRIMRSMKGRYKKEISNYDDILKKSGIKKIK